MNTRKKVKIFVSYAHRNKSLSLNFIDNLFEYIKPSKRYEYSYWNDQNLMLGEDFDVQIQKAITECDCGLLLLSPSFLNSKYIIDVELSSLIKENKKIIPVALTKIDLERHDLKGLKETQIYFYDKKNKNKPKSYSEYKSEINREMFISELFKKIEDVLNS